jgi:hypothetical protein
MAEAVLIVCDVCGRTPAETVRITAGSKSYDKDLCALHMAELLSNTRAPQRGRPRRTVAASIPQAAPARRRGRPARASGPNAPSGTARRGRPPKSAQAASGGGRPSPLKGRKITDPKILEKRRDALAKARAARAAKRAATA